MRSFASDNNSGVHPLILDAIVQANMGHAKGYGDDPWTQQAEQMIRDCFSDRAKVCFVFNGTGANVVALRAATQSFNSILAAQSAHIVMDECGAPGFASGCQLREISTSDGKLTPELLAPYLTGFGFVHHTQPKVVYISQCTEFGTIYTPDEVRALADLVHSHSMYLHMDGARLANAAAALGVSLAALTVDCGVDVLSLGGTKNGMMMGEAVVSFCDEISQNLEYFRKQSAQLYSKMRYTACQFIPYLTHELWRTNALHANAMASMLRDAVEEIYPQVEFSQKVEANTLLFALPKTVIDKLLKKHFFYIWNELNNEIRLVTSYDTTQQDVDALLADFRESF